MKLGVPAVASVAGTALCVVGATTALPPATDYSAAVASASNVYAVLDQGTSPTRLFITDSKGSVTRTAPNAMTLPWRVSVSYSLDGPDSTASKVKGATGLIGVHVTVKANGDESKSTVPVVAFTVPTHVSDDINVDSSVSKTQVGSNTLISAVGHSGSGLDFRCYINATEFTMSDIAVAVLPTAATAAASDAKLDVARLTADSATIVDSLTNASSSDHQDLIDQLTVLRDNERNLAQSVIAEREKTHAEAFKSYMAAYVGSYTTHLSGSIGSSTQLTALLGTAQELSGDTPLAKAVLGLADAVNNVSAAHQHTGAADALDDVIRRIQQQGTTGLADALTDEAGEDAIKGSNQYKAGQSQLSAAMIPYSMKYTDVYTNNLSLLTGGTSSGASEHQQEAIDETNKSDDLTETKTKVDAAMTTLATASEFTGKATALQQILLRFADQFDEGSTAAADDESTGGLLMSNSLISQAKATEAAAKTAERQEQAKKAQEQSKNADGTIASLVNDRMEMASGDVMNYAGGMVSSLGATATAVGQDMVESNNVPEGPVGNQSSTSSDDDDAASVTTGQTPSAYGFGAGGTTLLKKDLSMLIGETVEITDAGELIDQAATALADNHALKRATSAVAYLLVVPTV